MAELIQSSAHSMAVAASAWKHTQGSPSEGMGGCPVAHADVVGVAAQASLANMKPGDQFANRLFSGYVQDAVRRFGAGR